MNLYNLIWLFIGVSLIRSIINRLKYGKNSGKNMSRAEYQLYLKSGKWKRKREEVLKHYGGTCCVCGTDKDLVIHHRTYARVGNEPVEDLCVMCRQHHSAYHKYARSHNRQV